MANARSTNFSFQSSEPERPQSAEPLPGPGLRARPPARRPPAADACERVDLLADGRVLARTGRKERRRGSPGGELRGVVAGLRRGLSLGLQLVQRGGMDEAMATGADEQAGGDVGAAAVASCRHRRRGQR